MNVCILGSSNDTATRVQYVSSYLVNGTLAIDAGCLGFHGRPEDQADVRHVLLTHCHADHIASLPFFIENVWNPGPDCPAVYGSSETLDALRRFVFNDIVWPDFEALSRDMPPFIRMHVLVPEVCVNIGGLTVLPVCVNHTVPTFAYVVQDNSSAVIFAADSGPTERLWQVAREIKCLRAVFLEASFPNRMWKLADEARHLTPEMFCSEVAKAPEDVRIIAVHLKAAYRDEITRELEELQLPALEIGISGNEYTF